MSISGAEKVMRVCLGCGEEYEAHQVRFLGLVNPFVIGGGNCPACSKKKYDEEIAREQQELQEFIGNKREGWRRSCGIPFRFQGERFETFKDRGNESLHNAYDDCVGYADGFPLRRCQGYRSMVLFSDGVWGVGKTHLACSVAHRILDRWKGETESCPILYITEPSLFLRLRGTFHMRGEGYRETEAEVYRELTTIPLLVIDDMGKEEVSDPRFVQRALFAVINGRYDNMLPVLITANLNLEMLEAHLGGDRNNSAAFDRLMEMTENQFREIVATTYRDYKNRNDKKGKA